MKECGVFSSRFLLFPLVKVHDVFIIGPVKVPIKIVSKSFFPFVIGVFSSCIFYNF